MPRSVAASSAPMSPAWFQPKSDSFSGATRAKEVTVVPADDVESPEDESSPPRPPEQPARATARAPVVASTATRVRVRRGPLLLNVNIAEDFLSSKGPRTSSLSIRYILL